MMSVNELHYGNEPAPAWGVSTSAAQVKHYGPSYFGNYSLYSHESSSRHDQDAFHAYNRNSYNPSEDSYTSRYDDSQQLLPSVDSYTSRYHDSQQLPSQDSYTSRYHDSQQPAAASKKNARNNPRNNPTPYYVPSPTQYENSFGSRSMSHDRPQQSRDNNSSSYNYHTSGGNAKGAGTLVELRVPLCCEACEERVSYRLLEVRGVESVKCDQFQQKVVVRGNAAPADVLKVCKKLFKRSDFWRR